MTTEELIAALADFANGQESKLIDPKAIRPRLTRKQVAKALDDYIDRRVADAISKHLRHGGVRP